MYLLQIVTLSMHLFDLSYRNISYERSNGNVSTDVLVGPPLYKYFWRKVKRTCQCRSIGRASVIRIFVTEGQADIVSVVCQYARKYWIDIDYSLRLKNCNTIFCTLSILDTIRYQETIPLALCLSIGSIFSWSFGLSIVTRCPYSPLMC